MDAFEDNGFAEFEKDPVADFLQREQDQLAGLQDNFDALSTEDIAAKPQEEFNASLGYGSVMPTSGGELWDSKYPSETEQFDAREFEQVKQVPEKIKKWREEQAERLRLKDAESEKKKAEWRDIAKKELEEWYKHRDEILEKTMNINRSGIRGDSEDAFVTDRDGKTGGEWERVCRMCDFNPKGSRNSKDISRMRSILLQLKQTPIVH